LDAIRPVLHPAGSKAAKICSRQIFPCDHFAGSEMGKTKFSRRANTMDGVSQRQDVRGRAISEIRMIELRAKAIMLRIAGIKTKGL